MNPVITMKASPELLTEMLHSWRVAPPPTPAFRHAVWQRIAREKRATWPAYLRSHATAWSLATVVLLGAAGYTGNALARDHVRADREALVVTYLTDLDPRVQAVLKP